jgi:signal transduction histidine kinase
MNAMSLQMLWHEPLKAFASFLALTVGTILVGVLMRRYQQRSVSLRRAVLSVSMASLVIAFAATALAAELMVLPIAEIVPLLSVLVVAAAFVSLLVVVVSQPLGEDVDRLESTVRQIEAGELDVRVGIHRADELGRVANALDDLVGRLQALESERSAIEEERRTLLSNIGHDLRSPLAALQAALEALIDGVAPDPQRYLRSMQHDIVAMSALIDDLYLLARLDAGRFDLERGKVDVAELADTAIESLAPTASQRKIRVELDAANPVYVDGSGVALSRVIRNLIENAIRHAETGTVVTIAVSADRGALVRVTDTGPGFPDGFREHAFDRFTRADPSRNRSTGGGGLGLAIARGLVEAHGGEIWIDDTGNGSVSFRLPLSA